MQPRRAILCPAPLPGHDRHWHDIDPTVPEALFEKAFIDCYGRDALDRVTREFPVIDMNGHTRWVDYFIRTRTGNLAIEKNGEQFHQPIIIGKERYTSQLIKQNSLAANGIKVFRWSIQGMTSTENFIDEMKLFSRDPKALHKYFSDAVTRCIFVYPVAKPS